MSSLLKGKQIAADGTNGIATANLNTDVLSADAAGRGKVETDFFDSATVTDTFAASAIALDRLAEAVIQADGGQAFTGDQSMGNQKLTNLGLCSDPNDAARKSYVDGLVQGLDWKESCLVRAQGNITLSGPGATIDGITMGSGDRFLADQQSTAAEDGIYIWNGATSAATRAADLPAAAEARGTAVFVEEGTDADDGFVCTNDDGADVVGTDGLTFVAFTGGATPPYEVVGNIVALVPDASNSAGVNNTIARGDHGHGITCEAPDDAAQLGAAAAEGDATSFSRSDHVHKANTVAAALSDTAAIGTSQDIARADHVHSRDDEAQEEVTTEAITGTDTAITDTLNGTPLNNACVNLYLNGIHQQQGAGEDYTISGSTITWLASSGTAVDLEVSDTLIARYITQGA
jgi:hypothetical protein